MLGFAVWAACFTSQSVDSKPFPDIPENSWFYEGTLRARSLTSVNGYPQFWIRGRDYTRLELVGWTNSALKEVVRSLELKQSTASRLELVQEYRELLPWFDRVSREFSPELVELGFTWKDKLARLRPFSDVPKGHWAAEAVTDLRALGLISGYPDGKFRS